MTDEATFGAPDPDCEMVAEAWHRAREKAKRNPGDRDQRAFSAWWAATFQGHDVGAMSPEALANIAFLAGRQSILKEQRDEYRYAFPGLAE